MKILYQFLGGSIDYDLSNPHDWYDYWHYTIQDYDVALQEVEYIRSRIIGSHVYNDPDERWAITCTIYKEAGPIWPDNHPELPEGYPRPDQPDRVVVGI